MKIFVREGLLFDFIHVKVYRGMNKGDDGTFPLESITFTWTNAAICAAVTFASFITRFLVVSPRVEEPENCRIGAVALL